MMLNSNYSVFGGSVTLPRTNPKISIICYRVLCGLPVQAFWAGLGDGGEGGWLHIYTRLVVLILAILSF